MAVRILNKKGKIVTLLNPGEKGRKFVLELKEGIRYTNDEQVKVNKKGQPKRLTDLQRAYRSGYLQVRHDSDKCYNAQKGKSWVMKKIYIKRNERLSFQNV